MVFAEPGSYEKGRMLLASDCLSRGSSPGPDRGGYFEFDNIFVDIFQKLLDLFAQRLLFGMIASFCLKSLAAILSSSSVLDPTVLLRKSVASATTPATASPPAIIMMPPSPSMIVKPVVPPVGIDAAGQKHGQCKQNQQGNRR